MFLLWVAFIASVLIGGYAIYLLCSLLKDVQMKLEDIDIRSRELKEHFEEEFLK